MNDLDLALVTFTQEATELMEEMESSLLILEENPDDFEVINSVFRAMHTIKGSAGLFGFDHMVRFAHEAETVLDNVRDGKRVIDQFLISVLLDCKDHTSNLLEFSLKNPEKDLSTQLKDKDLELITKLTSDNSEKSDLKSDAFEAPHAEITQIEKEQSNSNWFIVLSFHKNAFRAGVDPLSFIRYLKTLGDIQSLILISDISDKETFDPESCYLQYEIAFCTDADKQTIEDVFEFASDDCDIKIIPPNSKTQDYLELLDHIDETANVRLGEMLISIGCLTKNDMVNALKTQIASQFETIKPIGEILIEQKIVDKVVVEKALTQQKQINTLRPNDKKVNETKPSASNFIRVDSAKLGQLIDLVGELVISGAAMELVIKPHAITEIEEVSASMNSLVSNIRDVALQLRMVPIGETFSRFKRVVRDVSLELGKNIELKITGGETELDKTVVEKINDPLTHLIRNSLDHGIATPKERIADGKPEKGTIELNAFHESGHIVIQIIDDGAGLDKKAILEKAISKGIVSEENNLSDQEIYNLIFAAGLSTKQQASDLSGRGVGMDVVRRNIESVRGTVDIDSSEGVGTTITITLPLTLAIIEGFMVEAENERYIIPLSMIEECVEMGTDEWKADEISNIINLRGDPMPYIRLAKYFNPEIELKNNIRQSLVVVRFGKVRAGFVVDALHGEQQTVIKPLGKIFDNLKGITGATVLGDGNVALILDVQGLISYATKNQ